VNVCDVVPIGPAGRISGRKARRRQLELGKKASVADLALADGAAPVLGEFADLQLEIVNQAVDTRPPFIQGGGDGLDFGDALILLGLELGELLVPTGGGFIEALVQESGLFGELLLDLVEDQLGVGIHGALPLLQTGEVAVLRKGIQDSMIVSDTRYVIRSRGSDREN